MNGTRNSSLLGNITVLFASCCCCLPIHAKYGGGTGEPNDPYLIYDANHMQTIGTDSNDWDKCFKLMSDIDLGGFDGQDGREEFNIIAPDMNYTEYGFQGTPFTGVFDGNGHAISKFTYYSPGKVCIGLFGCVGGGNAEVKNLRLTDPNVNAQYYVGCLVGLLQGGTLSGCSAERASISAGWTMGGLVGANSGTISYCYFAGSVSGISSEVGGLAGENWGGTIIGCYFSGSVWGHKDTGGLVGYQEGGTISNCYATGSVSAHDAVGGLVGFGDKISDCYATNSVDGNSGVGGLLGYNVGIISDCYATGSVDGDSGVGGLVGSNGLLFEQSYPLAGYIFNSYSIGIVQGTVNVGGLVGEHMDGEISACFWDTETSEQTTSAGGMGKTTAVMQALSTFASASWDFGTPVWVYYTGGYPRLAWEPPLPIGDLNHDGRVDFFDFAIVADHWMEEK